MISELTALSTILSNWELPRLLANHHYTLAFDCWWLFLHICIWDSFVDAKSSFKECLVMWKSKEEFTNTLKVLVLRESSSISTKKFINTLFSHIKLKKFVPIFDTSFLINSSYWNLALSAMEGAMNLRQCKSFAKRRNFLDINLFSSAMFTGLIAETFFTIAYCVGLLSVLETSTIYWVQRLRVFWGIFVSFQLKPLHWKVLDELQHPHQSKTPLFDYLDCWVILLSLFQSMSLLHPICSFWKLTQAFMIHEW